MLRYNREGRKKEQEKKTKHKRNKRKRVTDTVNVNPHASTFFLKVNRPNVAIKRERLSEQIKT